jgi:hypothetical protein
MHLKAEALPALKSRMLPRSPANAARDEDLREDDDMDMEPPPRVRSRQGED